MKSALFLILAAALLAAAPFASAQKSAAPAKPAQSADDLYEQGKAAFFRGDYVTAKAKLSQVLRLSPNHQPTIAMLHNIQLAENAVAAKNNSLESRMQRLMLPQLDVSDAPVPEVLDFIQLKAAEASHGARPNFIIKLEPATEKQKITLKLGQVSLYNALRAVATTGGLDVTYDTFAITIKTKPAAPPPAAAPPTNPPKGE